MEWTNTAIAHVGHRYFDDDASLVTIAAELGGVRPPTPEAVRQAIILHFPDRNNAKSAAARRERSSRDAAIRRDAVIGRPILSIAERYGVSLQTVYRLAPTATSRLSVEGRRRLMQRAGLLPGPKFAQSLPEEPAREGAFTSAGVCFGDLDPGACRFPIGRDHEGGYRFCGAPRADTESKTRKSYCTPHGETAVDQSEPTVSFRRPWRSSLTQAIRM